ncbi:MAG TPA: Clp protease N-terminal domain-containing protein [Trebonia sp.]
MPARFTGDGWQVILCAQEQARRLGHDFIGCEHLLYGLASGDGGVGAVLRERNVTPERVEAEFVRLIGPENTAAGSRFDTLDRDALTSIGIDLDTVRNRIEAAFGPGALAPDAPASRGRRRSRRHRGSGRVAGHLPVTRRAKKCLRHSPREAGALPGGHVGAEQIALALLTMDNGLPRRILSAIGASAPQLRADILDQGRRPPDRAVLRQGVPGTDGRVRRLMLAHPPR